MGGGAPFSLQDLKEELSLTSEEQAANMWIDYFYGASSCRLELVVESKRFQLAASMTGNEANLLWPVRGGLCPENEETITRLLSTDGLEAEERQLQLGSSLCDTTVLKVKDERRQAEAEKNAGLDLGDLRQQLIETIKFMTGDLSLIHI